MTITETYLTSLQGKIFKLLPMREAYDQGADNHLSDYLDNLCTNFDGAFACYSDLCRCHEMAILQGNLWALKSNVDMNFQKWRSTVLRSTRLVQTILSRYSGGAK